MSSGLVISLPEHEAAPIGVSPPAQANQERGDAGAGEVCQATSEAHKMAEAQKSLSKVSLRPIC
jgi:hypothetical protein